MFHNISWVSVKKYDEYTLLSFYYSKTALSFERNQKKELLKAVKSSAISLSIFWLLMDKSSILKVTWTFHRFNHLHSSYAAAEMYTIFNNIRVD